MIDGAAGKAITESIVGLVKWGAITIAVLAPFGIWKIVELVAGLI